MKRVCDLRRLLSRVTRRAAAAQASAENAIRRARQQERRTTTQQQSGTTTGATTYADTLRELRRKNYCEHGVEPTPTRGGPRGFAAQQDRARQAAATQAGQKEAAWQAFHTTMLQPLATPQHPLAAPIQQQQAAEQASHDRRVQALQRELAEAEEELAVFDNTDGAARKQAGYTPATERVTLWHLKRCPRTGVIVNRDANACHNMIRIINAVMTGGPRARPEALRR